jgi:hypothetical protein
MRRFWTVIHRNRATHGGGDGGLYSLWWGEVMKNTSGRLDTGATREQLMALAAVIRDEFGFAGSYMYVCQHRYIHVVEAVRLLRQLIKEGESITNDAAYLRFLVQQEEDEPSTRLSDKRAHNKLWCAGCVHDARPAVCELSGSTECWWYGGGN